MAFPYFPHTDGDVSAMLSRIGVSSLQDLYADVPEEFLLKGEPDLPDALSEEEVRAWFNAVAAKNIPLKVFAGGGVYDHYTPSVVPYILSRSEFLTAYTPYQCEISQGTLRYIFEYQSMVCALTGMDVANASMYDGPTAAAEAVRMAVASAKKRNRVLVSEGLLPQVLDVVRTYAEKSGIRIDTVPVMGGQTCPNCLRGALAAGDVAGVLVPQINRFGIVEDHSGFAESVHGAGALLIEYCDPSALAVIKTPAELDADIAVGDGQSLGIPMTFGGPYVGFMAAKKEHLRKMPGRIVGETVDRDGKRAYVLTLQAREQHIRRAKATSNICSNQSLMALFVTVYLSLMGPEGLREVNELSADGALYLHDALLETGLFEEAFPGKPFLKEFTLRSRIPAEKLQEQLLRGGFFGALDQGDGRVSFAVTERRTKEEIDALVALIKEVRL